jgi:hypothetical protein
MAFNDIEIQKIKNSIETELMAKRRPPVAIRKEVDLGYHLEGQSIVLFESRPHWQDKTQRLESEIAKITYVKTQKTWKLYWMRQDLKWHGYEPLPQAKTLEDLLAEVVNDPYGCFFG